MSIIMWKIFGLDMQGRIQLEISRGTFLAGASLFFYTSVRHIGI
jgi:hypothetical protein